MNSLAIELGDVPPPDGFGEDGDEAKWGLKLMRRRIGELVDCGNVSLETFGRRFRLIRFHDAGFLTMILALSLNFSVLIH